MNYFKVRPRPKQQYWKILLIEIVGFRKLCRGVRIFLSYRLVLQDLKAGIEHEIKTKCECGYFLSPGSFLPKIIQRCKSKWFEWVANTRWRAVDNPYLPLYNLFQEFLIFLLTFLLKYIIIITVKKRS